MLSALLGKHEDLPERLGRLRLVLAHRRAEATPALSVLLGLALSDWTTVGASVSSRKGSEDNIIEDFVPTLGSTSKLRALPVLAMACYPMHYSILPLA